MHVVRQTELFSKIQSSFFVEREVHVSIHHTAYGKYTAIYLPEKILTLFPTKSNILDMEERWQQVLQQ